jgi:hypothetical protein
MNNSRSGASKPDATSASIVRLVNPRSLNNTRFCATAKGAFKAAKTGADTSFCLSWLTSSLDAELLPQRRGAD